VVEKKHLLFEMHQKNEQMWKKLCRAIESDSRHSHSIFSWILSPRESLFENMWTQDRVSTWH